MSEHDEDGIELPDTGWHKGEEVDGAEEHPHDAREHDRLRPRRAHRHPLEGRVNDSHTLIPMGVGEPEAVRCRVYGADPDPEEEAARRAFVAKLADEGVIDCPAYDGWVAALQARGWLPARPDIEFYKAHVVGRWRLTDKGREEWAKML